MAPDESRGRRSGVAVCPLLMMWTALRPLPQDGVRVSRKESEMKQVMTIGLDIAKSVFLVHGVDAAGHVVLRQKLSRSRVLEFFAKLPRCLVGIEACASSHYWARELIALGHEVKLIPAQYVKPYVKRGKNDAADAEAICEAVTRPTMRFVGVKTPEQQSIMMLHRVRLILMRQRTQLSNALRSHLAEYEQRLEVGFVVDDQYFGSHEAWPS